MTERDTVRLLEAIKGLAQLGYPYPADTGPIDGRLVLCLGQIGGLVSKTLAEFEPRIIPAPESAL